MAMTNKEIRKLTTIRHGRHCVFNMHVHLVFVTKYRHCVFTQQHYASMQKLFTELRLDFEASLAQFNGEGDHVHLLVEYPPKTCVSKLVNSLKGVSSRKLKQFHPELKQQYWQGMLWSPSYFAAICGGAPIEIVRKYIEDQQRT